MRVLLVHEDANRLSRIAQALREMGLSVAVASTPPMATERAAIGEYDAVLVSRELAEVTEDGLGVIDALALELPQPPPVIVLVSSEHDPSPSETLETDTGAIVSRVSELQPARRERSSLMPTTFTTRKTPIAELLLAFADEKRSGTLTVTSSTVRAVACLREGKLVDVLHGRQQGEKALARVVSVRDANTQFTPGEPDVLARLDDPTTVLVARARERAEALAMLAERLPDTFDRIHYVQSASFTEGDDRGLATKILDRLRGPSSLAILLDELPQPDAEVLGAVLTLESTGHVRRVDSSHERAPLAPVDELQQLRASASKGPFSGFGGLTRIVLAGAPHRLSIAAQAMLGIAETVSPDEPIPALPLPHSVAELRLGEGVAVDIVGLPLVPAYAPLWPLAVAGAHAIVTLDDASHETLEDVCRSAARHVHSARALVPAFDVSRAPDLAALFRAALELGS